jgi:hypothetical protein
MYINTLFPVQDMVSYICIWHEIVHIYHACFYILLNTTPSQYTRCPFDWVTKDSAFILLWL